MSRTAVACGLGVVFVVGWLVAAASLADLVQPAGGAMLGVFYAVFGVAWVYPVYKLMRWSLRTRQPEVDVDGPVPRG